jgi:hypothetical protein
LTAATVLRISVSTAGSKRRQAAYSMRCEGEIMGEFY